MQKRYRRDLHGVSLILPVISPLLLIATRQLRMIGTPRQKIQRMRQHR
jgi:hypothetical protein